MISEGLQSSTSRISSWQTIDSIEVSYLESDGGLGPLRGRRGAADDDPRGTPLVDGRVLVEEDGAEVARRGGGGRVVASDAADGAAALQMVDRRLAESRLDPRRSSLVLLEVKKEYFNCEGWSILYAA